MIGGKCFGILVGVEGGGGGIAETGKGNTLPLINADDRIGMTTCRGGAVALTGTRINL
jgi:hypothetical protein